jgi:hypothetical protein
MANNPCDLVQIKYKGDGIQKLFTFPFTYLDQADIFVSFWDDTTKDYVEVASDKWSLVNATTIEFLTPPPVPPVGDPLDPPIFNVSLISLKLRQPSILEVLFVLKTLTITLINLDWLLRKGDA